MRRDYLDCATCGGRVEVFTRPAENGRELTANCHGMWLVEIASAKPTRDELIAFLIKAQSMPRKGAA